MAHWPFHAMAHPCLIHLLREDSLGGVASTPHQHAHGTIA